MGTEVASLGVGCEPLRMVLVDDTWVEFEARLKDASESGTTREKEQVLVWF